MREKKLELQEGVDFYIEAGRWVFTSAYLLNRGYCCQCGCRYCPYDNADSNSKRQSQDQQVAELRQESP